GGVDRGGGDARRGDGRRGLPARNRAGPHQCRWRHGVHAGDRRLARRRRRRRHRRDRRRCGCGRNRARDTGGDQHRRRAGRARSATIARPLALHLGLLLGDPALLVGLGLWIGRRVAGTRDFFVAGRRLGPGLIFSTMLAANIGGGSTVGATGLGYRDGLSAWWWVGSAALGSVVLALWIGPRIRRLAA